MFAEVVVLISSAQILLSHIQNISSPPRKTRGNNLRRRIDHIVGTPLLCALSWSRPKRPVPAKIETVGILSCSALGDTIIASGIARDMKCAIPECRIIVFTPSVARGVSSFLEGFDEEVYVPIRQPIDAFRIMNKHPTDVLIDITPWPRITALATALAKTRFTIGFWTNNQHRHFAYDAVVPHSGHQHEIENFRTLLAPLNIPGKRRPRARAEFRSVVGPVEGSSTIIFHPWASGFRSAMREWPMDRWATLARKLIAADATISITGGLADQQRAEALSAMIGWPGRVKNLAGKASLLDTARYVAKADVVVSVNTGIMHLAAALDQRLVALHGPTDPGRWGPLSKRAVVIGPGRSQGGAYLNLGFEYPKAPTNCMALIEVDNVLTHVRQHVRPVSCEPLSNQ